MYVIGGVIPRISDRRRLANCSAETVYRTQRSPWGGSFCTLELLLEIGIEGGCDCGLDNSGSGRLHRNHHHLFISDTLAADLLVRLRMRILAQCEHKGVVLFFDIVFFFDIVTFRGRRLAPRWTSRIRHAWGIGPRCDPLAIFWLGLDTFRRLGCDVEMPVHPCDNNCHHVV